MSASLLGLVVTMTINSGRTRCRHLKNRRGKTVRWPAAADLQRQFCKTKTYIPATSRPRYRILRLFKKSLRQYLLLQVPFDLLRLPAKTQLQLL